MNVDLSSTNFDRTILKDAELVGSLFFPQKLDSAILERITITFYFAMKVDPSLRYDDIFEPLRKHSDASKEREFLNRVSIRSEILKGDSDWSLIELHAAVKDYANIESARAVLASIFHTDVAVYANEIETLCRFHQVKPRRGSEDLINKFMH